MQNKYESSPLYLRMKQALNWLKREKNLLQKDIAEKMKMSEVGFTRAMERIKHKNDENFVIKFHQATGEIFSLDWLLNGEGDKFAPKKEERQPAQPPHIDQSSLVNALIAAKDQLIEELQDKLRDKDARIEDLKQLAEERLHRIAELRRVIDANNMSIDYPFPVGAADNHAAIK